LTTVVAKRCQLWSVASLSRVRRAAVRLAGFDWISDLSATADLILVENMV